MAHLTFALRPVDYTLKNALLWGNFRAHCIKAIHAKWGHRIVHVFIAILQFPPVISQIASLFEMVIVRSCMFKVRTHHRNRVRAIITDQIDDKIKKSIPHLISQGASPKNLKEGEESPKLPVTPPVNLPNITPSELSKLGGSKTPSPATSDLSETPSSDSETPVSVNLTADMQLEQARLDKIKSQCILL